MPYDSRDDELTVFTALRGTAGWIGEMIVANPASVGAATAFGVAMTFFTANAVYFQENRHPSALFATRPEVVRVVAQDDAARCMGYAAFLDRWDDPAFQARLAPMIALLDGLTPDHQHRWQRLRLFATGLDDISAQCRQLLDLSDGETPP